MNFIYLILKCASITLLLINGCVVNAKMVSEFRIKVGDVVEKYEIF